MPTAEELLMQIDAAEHDRQLALKKIAVLKKQLMERESELIESSITKERAQEALQLLIASTPVVEYSERDSEIDDFRTRFSELCQMAEARDKKEDDNGSGRDS